MAQLGGFFAVSYLAESAVLKALDDAWKAGWKLARGPMFYTVATPVGPLVANGAISVYKPTLNFVGASNVVRVQLPTVARLDLQLDGVVAGGVYIDATPTIDVPIVVEQTQASRKGTADLSGFTIDPGQMNLTWYDESPGGNSTTAVLSEPARRALTDELRRRAAPFVSFVLPTDVDWATELGTLTAGGTGSIVIPNPKLSGARILDDWLAVGIDDTNATPTHGNLGQIGPPPALPPELSAPDDNVALIIHSGMLQTYLNSNAAFAVSSGVAKKPDVHPHGVPSITVHDDLIEINTGGQVDAPSGFSGTMPFTASIKVQPFFNTEHWMYASVSPTVKVDAPWYMTVLGDIAEFFGKDAYKKLNRANQGSLAVLFKAAAGIDVPGLPGLTAYIGARQMVLRPDMTGIYGHVGTNTWAPEPPTEPKFLVEPMGSVHIRDRFLQFGFLEVWAPLLFADPTYRLRYQVKRGSDGTSVLSGTGWSGSATFGEPLDMWDPSVYQETTYHIEATLERAPGNQIDSTSRPVLVQDLFDRSHPFARWHRRTVFYTGNPVTSKEKVRVSAVHKTAITERCKFSDAGTRNSAEYTVQALDSVPPADDSDFSSRLCPYCFGGG
jgi:hypothetical protein